MNLDIEKFSPKEAELRTMAAESIALTLPDPTDAAQLEKITTARKGLKKARVEIEKTGKVWREDATKFSKLVIAKEKELVAIIEPEELRLEQLEILAAKHKEREGRRLLLPNRWSRIREAMLPGDENPMTEDKILDMDGPTFEGYLNKLVAHKNFRVQKQLDDDRAALNKEAAEIQHNKDLAAAEDRGRQEAEERRQQKERDDEARRIAEVAKLEKEERYQAFLKQHGVPENPDNFYVEHRKGEVRVYMLTGVLKLDE